jgi:hypothetical protein
MNVGALPVVTDAATKRQATTHTPRVLLLFSALMVIVSTVGHGNSLASVAALIVAAAATGVALLHPMAVRGRVGQRRAEWVMVVSLVVAGLMLTGGLLAQAFADLGSPLWLMVTAVYTIVGLAGALLAFRKLPHVRWAFALFLLAHTAMAVALLRSSPAIIDTQVYLHDGVAALFQGHNPYAMTVPNLYPPHLANLFYGPGVVVNGRVNAGFPYLPVPLLAAVPGFVWGDVRYSQLIAMVLTALVLRRLASDSIGRAAAVLGVASLTAIPMLKGGWTEPTSVALLACLVLALQQRRHAFVAVLLGLLLASKQYFVVVIPIIWLIRAWLTQRVILIGLGLAGAIMVPFLLVDPATFWKAITGSQRGPLRADSISLLVSSVNTLGWPPPWTYGVLPLLGAGMTAIALTLRAPHTPPAFVAAVGLTLLVAFLLSRQAFMNYYYLVSGTFLIAAVAWPTSQAVTAPGHESRHPASPETTVGRPLR